MEHDRADGDDRVAFRELKPAGSCHCGAVQVDLALSRDPAELTLRACRCGFCTPRGARTISDPGGLATVRCDAPEALIPYRFGLRTADYLLCAACGTYVAAVQRDEPPLAVVNVGGLGVPEFEGREAEPVDHAGETVAARIARRRGYWMPVAFAFTARLSAARPAGPPPASVA